MKKTIRPLLPLLISLVLLLPGCTSEELSRPQAQKLIEAGNDYRQPFTLSLMQGDIVGRGEGLVPVKDATNAPAAEERAVKEYFELYPQVAIANHLGLVEVRVKAMDLEESKRRTMDGGSFWHLDEKYLPTDKAKALWNEYNLPPTADTIPLAKKEIVEVTGITKQGEERATAQFTWKFVPNEAGKAYDNATAEFKNLPADLQRLLDGTLPPSDHIFKRKNETMSYDGSRQGEAMFRRYDDGWRLEAAMFR